MPLQGSVVRSLKAEVLTWSPNAHVLSLKRGKEQATPGVNGRLRAETVRFCPASRLKERKLRLLASMLGRFCFLIGGLLS